MFASNQTTLADRKVAFLLTDGFEQSEFTEPWNRLKQAGAQVTLVSLKSGKIQGMNHDQKADTFQVDQTLDQVSSDDFDALVLPGGVANPDTLRTHEAAVSFVRDFYEQGKPIGAICHGPWLLVEADIVEGREVTSWPSLKTDLLNAGGNWVDEACVCDEGIVTSRKPDDLPAFCDKLVEEIAEGKHART